MAKQAIGILETKGLVSLSKPPTPHSNPPTSK
jgi:hypothetical protein